jgi:predicted signal transduction protein with EAL and GGDEF domain
VGIASWPADESDRDSLVLAADRACYAAKAAGRDRAATAAEAARTDAQNESNVQAQPEIEATPDAPAAAVGAGIDR